MNERANPVVSVLVIVGAMLVTWLLVWAAATVWPRLIVGVVCMVIGYSILLICRDRP